MENRKIMILGGGIYQMPLIQKAKEMGLTVLAVSIPGDYPGLAFADKVLSLDTTDREGCLAAARKEGIAGVCTTGTDVAIGTLGRICDRMGLCGLSEEAAGKVTDKASMKAAFRGKVRTSPFFALYDRALPAAAPSALKDTAGETAETSRAAVCGTQKKTMPERLQEAREAARSIGFPVMVKAANVSGSRGVTRADTEEELQKAVNAAWEATRTDHILVEGFVSGTEIGVEGFAFRGKLIAFYPHRKMTASREGVTVPAGHAFPFSGSPALLAAIRRELEAIIASTGIDNCAINCDMMVTCEDVYVIEAGGRCGATCIPELLERYTGINYYEQILRCALGEEIRFPEEALRGRGLPGAGASARLLFSPRDGKVIAVDREALTRLQQETGASVSLDVTEGDTVEAMRNGTSRIGQVILSEDNEEKLDWTLAQALACLTIR